MPQMMPLNWIFLYLMFLIILVWHSNVIYLTNSFH